MNRRDFVNLNRAGKRFQTEHFTIIFMKNGLGIARLGITVTRKIGNAVKRNRIKRRVREYFRLHKDLFPKDYDFVISAKKGSDTLDFLKVKEELGEFILDKKIRILS